MQFDYRVTTIQPVSGYWEMTIVIYQHGTDIVSHCCHYKTNYMVLDQRGLSVLDWVHSETIAFLRRVGLV